MSGGEHFKKTPSRALEYYSQALRILDCFNKDKEFKSHPLNQELQSQRKSIETIFQNIKTEQQSSLKQALLSNFPKLPQNCLIASQDSFFVYIPLDKIPKKEELILSAAIKSTIEIVKEFNNEEINGKKLTGIRIKALTFDIEKIIQSIQSLLRHIEEALLPSTPLPKTKSVKGAATKIKMAQDVNNNNCNDDVFIANANYLTMSNTKPKKPKKIQAPIPQQPVIVRPPIAAAIKILPTTHAADFGFTCVNNPEVTPVYFSSQGQKAAHPTVFLRWEGIPNIAPEVEELFHNMLNFNIQGIVTVGVRNQPGAKLFSLPQALGDNWHLCGLRLKRKGTGGGWVRAIALAQEKVTVETADGKTENHYLFSLGKAKNK